MIDTTHLVPPNVKFQNWRHNITQHEYIGYGFTGDMAEANSVIKYFGRFQFDLSAMGLTPIHDFILLDLESGNLDFPSIFELVANFTLVTSNPKQLSPITAFAYYRSSVDGEVVKAMQIPLFGGIRRWLEFTPDAHALLDITPLEVYCAVRQNRICRERKDSYLEINPGDWVVKDSARLLRSLKPSEFEAIYKPEDDLDLNVADFSDALMWLKEGKRVARSGWNAGGQFCWMVPEGKYPARMEAIKGLFPDDTVPYGAYFALKNAQSTVVPWVPSVGDLLATDWVVVE